MPTLTISFILIIAIYHISEYRHDYSQSYFWQSHAALDNWLTVIQCEGAAHVCLVAACACLACSGFFMCELITFREADMISVLSEGLDPVTVHHFELLQSVLWSVQNSNAPLHNSKAAICKLRFDG